MPPRSIGAAMPNWAISVTELAALALAELLRRREALGEALRARQFTRPAAEALAARWCGIAAWHGALLPDELRPHEGVQLWIDHAPRGLTAAQWCHELAIEARRAWAAADHKAPGSDHARALQRLAAPLCLAARLPLTEPPAPAAAMEKAA